MKKVVCLSLCFSFVSSVFGLTPTNYLFRQTLDFTNYTRATPLTNFPLLIRFDTTTMNLYQGMASPFGGDLRFTDESLTNEIP
ncbi:MAG: hypothetical protein AAF492_20650, partial [Verrucomicrobiota bacterium]